MTETFTRQWLPELEVRSAGDGRTVEGIAVPYGKPQVIDSRLTEQFARGAFSAQIRAAHRVPFFRDHFGRNGEMGGTLIGRAIELRDDAAGLFTRFRVSRTEKGDETLELIKDGALSELSIGFREGQNRKLPGGVVERRSATLTEVAIVMAGAYGEAATVTAVRSTATVDRRTQLDQIVATLPVLSADAEALTRASAHGGSNLKYGPGSPLWEYWTGPEGLARYATSPHPWTALRDALISEGVPTSMADGLATNIMQATPAGRALFAKHHGGHAA
ncbi:HK97 family phage prohead protease [Amycolatopsis viridis]|uniref:HK97 family phage prohead protease n=1 Tax=Amycolatopsis viridis TaxID=185678 RepID=A0ABX0SXJ8_9PSEU|nr:HK97 family phage prohead protease [Amycolatopsis viridis]NIH81694.1 HK97 family phage prohead protease [Amycolatopsis viridis]